MTPEILHGADEFVHRTGGGGGDDDLAAARHRAMNQLREAFARFGEGRMPSVREWRTNDQGVDLARFGVRIAEDRRRRPADARRIDDPVRATFTGAELD